MYSGRSSRLPAVLALVVLAVLAYGLVLVPRENLKVAPYAKEAREGRRHVHMKNVTRFPGSPEEVRRLVQRAVYLDEGPPPVRKPLWQEEIRAALPSGRPLKHIVVLPGEGRDALVWALPGAYWAVYYGSPVFFAGRETLDPGTEQVIRSLGVPVYVAAPASLISDSVLERIRQSVPARRVAGETLPSHAVRLAEFRDPETEFGWGRTHDRRNGYFEYVAATPSEAEQLLAALPLARSNAAALLFTGDDGSVPGETDRYVWKQRADWFVTPSEGPFRHLWIVGDRTSYASQARLDHALEKGDYPARGPTALGPMEALLSVFIMLGWASGIFVFVHAMRLLPEVPLGVRVAWGFTALLVPVLGAVLYVIAYRRPRTEAGASPARFERSGIVQGAAATAMSFGYGAPVMIAIAFLFVFYGFPLFFGEWAVSGVDFLFGAGMVIMMAVMWAGAVLVAWPLAQYPIHREIMPGMPPAKLARKTLLVVTLSMTAVSLGMMTTAWWMEMSKLPMMPHEDEILFMGSMWYASFIGFLIAWPLNRLMVGAGIKTGGV